MKTPGPLLNPHRFARIVTWAKTMLAWLAMALFADDAPIHRRRIRQRYRFASLQTIERLVRALALIRTIEITRIRKRPRPPLRNAAPAGFRRRMRRSGLMRATAGARFRKALKARDARERMRRLVEALSDIDGFVRRYLVGRALRRLTRLDAVVMLAPPADAVRSLFAPEPRGADSS
jgi:hypothetical protein